MIESFNPLAESKDTNEVSSDRTVERKKDKKDAVDKKKLGTFTAKNVVEAPNVHRPKAEKPTLWQELAGERGKKTDSERQTDVKKDKTAETGKEDGEKANVEIEHLDTAERQEVVRRIAEARAAEIRETEASEEAEDMLLAQDAASIALMESVQKKLEEQPDAPVEAVLDEAEAETVERIQSDDAENDEATGEAQSGAEAEETPGEAEPVEPGAPTEGEIPLHAEAAPEDDDATILIPRSGGGGATPPPGSGGSGGSGSAGSSGGSSGGAGGGGGGGMPPHTPGGGAMPPFGGAPYGGPVPTGMNFNAAPLPTPAPGISPEDLNRIVYRQERTAMAQGLLIGGIIGYLIGRRRGRIKTEKRLLPIQEKLEKQVAGLQSTVMEKDQKVRRLAAEKARDMATQEQRERFARRLAEAEAVRAEASERLESRIRRKEAAKESPRPLRLGRMVVEAPAIVLAGAAAGSEREAGIELPKAATLPKKKVENYTGAELKEAAAKIRVDGTSLKEMRDRGQLNDRAVERIVTQYIEGRSVRAALNKELFEEEARFEIDPKLRDAKNQSGSISGSGSDGSEGGKAPVLQAGAAMLLRTLDSGAAGTDSKSGAQKAQPSKFASIRQHPTAQMAAAGAVIMVLLIIAAYLLF